jgi:hypothetical protein
MIPFSLREKAPILPLRGRGLIGRMADRSGCQPQPDTMIQVRCRRIEVISAGTPRRVGGPQ